MLGDAESIGEGEAPTRQALRVMKEQNLSHVAHYNNWVSAWIDRFRTAKRDPRSRRPSYKACQISRNWSRMRPVAPQMMSSSMVK